MFVVKQFSKHVIRVRIWQCQRVGEHVGVVWVYHRRYFSELHKWRRAVCDVWFGEGMLLMPSPGETIVYPDCPCCGGSSSSSPSISSGSSSGPASCPGCPPISTTTVTFTLAAGPGGTLFFPGGASSLNLTYDAGSDTWGLTYSFFGTISLSFVCRSSSCLILASVSSPGCASVGSTFTPSNGMTMVLNPTGGICPTYYVVVTW